MFCLVVFVVFFKQKTAYEMRISDWSSDVCSSDLASALGRGGRSARRRGGPGRGPGRALGARHPASAGKDRNPGCGASGQAAFARCLESTPQGAFRYVGGAGTPHPPAGGLTGRAARKGVGQGKGVAVRVDLGCAHTHKKRKVTLLRTTST